MGARARASEALATILDYERPSTDGATRPFDRVTRGLRPRVRNAEEERHSSAANDLAGR